MSLAAVQSLQNTALPLSDGAGVTYAPAMDRAVEDSALMLRYRDGDVAAFEALYRRHNDALFRYLLRLCRHRATAEDVFQEVWGKIIKARGSYRPTAKFSTFLYRVAHNCFVDNLRRNRRHAQTANVEPDSQPDTGERPCSAGFVRRRGSWPVFRDTDRAA